MGTPESRRRFLWVATGTGLLLPAAARAGAAGQKPPAGHEPEGDEEEISPAEDLMREHGVLDRVLLIYEDVERRLIGSEEVDPGVLRDAAGIVRGNINSLDLGSDL